MKFKNFFIWIGIACFCLLIYMFCANDCGSSVADSITAIVAFLTCALAWWQLSRINATDSSRFLLELRESFSEKRRWRIHRAIRNNTASDAIYLFNHMTEVNDYLGLFEICEEMIERKTISVETFKNFYFYRLEYILDNKWMLEKLLGNKKAYWAKLYKLIKRFPELKNEYSNNKIQSDFWEMIEDE